MTPHQGHRFTIGGGAGYLCAGLLFGASLAEELTGPWPWLQRAVRAGLAPWRSFRVGHFMRLLSELGDPAILLGLTAVLLLGLAAVQAWRLLIQLGATVVATAAVTALLKLLIPVKFSAMVGPHWVEFSFPSGHAALGAALFGGLALALGRAVPPVWRWLVLPPLLVPAVLIGISRLYLGVHRPAEVLAGWAIALVMIMYFAPSARPRLRQNQSAETRLQRSDALDLA